MRQLLVVIVSMLCAVVLLAGCGGEAGNNDRDARGAADRPGERGGASGQRGGNWQQEMRASIQAAQVPLADAIATAATQVAGPVVGARLQGGENGPVWSVQVMADTMFYAVEVSATNGEVLSVGPAQMRAPRGRGNGGERDGDGERGNRGNRGNRDRGNRGN
jgi:hypothetical protein